MRRVAHDAIMVSGPPFSSFQIGARLARLSNIPLVLDYRDEWGISNRYWENRGVGGLMAYVQQRMQRAVLRAAAAVVGTTQASASSLAELIQGSGSNALATCIYNGFDPADFMFDDRLQHVADQRLRIVYVGTLWKLTTIAPLVDALLAVGAVEPSFRSRLELVVAGRRTVDEEAQLERLKQAGIPVQLHGYLDHSAAIEVMRSASELCVTLAAVDGAERVMPAKVFEYLALGRPVLGITPSGELADLLSSVPSASVFDPRDTSGIVNHFRKQLCGESLSVDVEGWSARDRGFDRISQTRQLAELLDEIVAQNESGCRIKAAGRKAMSTSN
jgi:glycosyltransferase involved in cell wall biosynthesis